MIIERKMFATRLGFNNNNNQDRQCILEFRSHVISSQSAEKRVPTWKEKAEAQH